MKSVNSAPSNIALIKYMGKSDAHNNLPTNSSLSYTLENLRSFVEIELDPKLKEDTWSSLNQLDDQRFESIDLTDKGIQKFIKHFQKMKQDFGVTENFHIRSANNFPSDCGLASSASSFAALTKAANQLFQEMKPKEIPLNDFEMAEVSRAGSGSSCRSFFQPWCLWSSNGGVRPIEFPVGNLLHQVVVIDEDKKEVSSSDAHKRVLTSPNFPSRPERAEKRLAELMMTFRMDDWKRSFELVWDEFIDMHELFETSQPSFTYMNDKTTQALKYLKAIWTEKGDGPLITMDAGPNIHLLYRQDQVGLKIEVGNYFAEEFKII